MKLLEPLFGIEGVSFVSIQRELRDDDAALLARHANVTHLGAGLADMADTAAVTAIADLIIAVDTSVVHLAGAMGRDVWVLLPFRRTGDGHSPARTALGIRGRGCFVSPRQAIGQA